jgi:hypothetical protein
MDLSMVKELLNGQMDPIMKVIGMKGESKAKEYMYKMMAEFTMDNGNQT